MSIINSIRIGMRILLKADPLEEFLFNSIYR